jgi:acetyl esterase/lipase
LVAAIDFRVAPKDPYPAQVIDVNYGARWWKNESKVYNGDSSSFGILGVSSGGHTAMLNALCPARPDYIKRPFLVNEAPVDASVDYYIGISAVLDSHARYLYAKDEGMESLIRGSLAYFGDEERMKSGSPQYILENGEFERLPTSLLIHGSEDANVPNHIPVNFELTYQSRGGELELVIFDGMPHSFVRDPQPESDEAIEIMKNFIARQL